MKARILVLVLCLSLAVAGAFAHGGEEHVLGTVTAVAHDSITVKTAKASVSVAIAATTKFIKNKTAAKMADLNVGDRVVIHATEPTEGKLVAESVEFAAAKPAQVAKPAAAPAHEH